MRGKCASRSAQMCVVKGEMQLHPEKEDEFAPHVDKAPYGYASSSFMSTRRRSTADPYSSPYITHCRSFDGMAE